MNNPFEALAGLRDSLPEGEKSTRETTAPETDKGATKTATIFYERKGRAGKEATIIEIGGEADETEMKDLASELKRRMATGGSVRGQEILLQGDRRKQAREVLSKLGFRVKG